MIDRAVGLRVCIISSLPFVLATFTLPKHCKTDAICAALGSPELSHSEHVLERMILERVYLRIFY